MFRTHRAIVHRDRTFSEPLTGVVYNGDTVRACVLAVSFHVAFSLITSQLKPFDTFGRACTRAIWTLAGVSIRGFAYSDRSIAFLVQFGIRRNSRNCTRAKLCRYRYYN